VRFQIEGKIEAVERLQQRRKAIKVGMERAKQWGGHVGRPSGSTTTDDDRSIPLFIRSREVNLMY